MGSIIFASSGLEALKAGQPVERNQKRDSFRREDSSISNQRSGILGPHLVVPERKYASVRLAFFTVRQGFCLPPLLLLLLLLLHAQFSAPLSVSSISTWNTSTTTSLYNSFIAQHSRSFLRHLDLDQQRSIPQRHVRNHTILRPTICLERAAAKALLPLFFFDIATLYDRDRLPRLTAVDRIPDGNLHNPVHDILILSMHATTQHVPLCCPSTGIRSL